MNGFREMRRSRQILSEDECIDILTTATSGTLAVLGDSDYPYAVPLSFVYSGGRIYFHSATSGHKVDAVAKHDKASFCVIAQDNVCPQKFTTFFRSIIAFGKVSIVDDEVERRDAIRLLGLKYSPGSEEELEKEIESAFARMIVIRLDIEHLTGKEAIELVRQRTGIS